MSASAVNESGAVPVARINWRSLSELRTDKGGNLVFPPVAAVPGIYRFLIDDGTRTVAGYIGQAKKSLAKRFGLYRSRGKKPSLPLDRKTTSRIACRLLRELAAGHTVRVEILDDRATYPGGGQDLVLDFADKATRSGLERRLILELCGTGIEVLNRDWNPQWAANSPA
jgi:hypothetical protein